MAVKLSAGWRLSGLYAAVFAGLGVYLPFFPVWLERQALAPSAIGVILAIPILVRIVVTAPLMSLCDRAATPRVMLVGANLALAAIYAAYAASAGDATVIAALAVAMAVAQASVIPAADLVTLDAVRRDATLDYGRVRLWGSVAYLVLNVAGGYAIAAAGADAVIWALAALSLGTALVAAAAVPAASRGEERTGDGERPDRRIGRSLWLVIAAAACIQASHAPVGAFGSIHWTGLGFSTAEVGYLWAVGVVVEIAVFALLGRSVGRLRAGLLLLVLGGATAVLRFAGLAVVSSFPAFLALQALHGLTFGSTHLGTMAALAALAPPAARGRAQGASSAAIALASAAATMSSGWIYGAAGAAVFLAAVPLALAGLAVAAVLLLRSPEDGGAAT